MDTCVICGEEIKYDDGTHRKSWHPKKYCSYECVVKSKSVLKKTKTEKPINKTCAYCKEEFTPNRSDAEYCSPKCKQSAYRERKQSAVIEPQRKYKMTVITVPENEWFDETGTVSYYGVGCANMHQSLKNLGFDPANYDFEIEEISYHDATELMERYVGGHPLPFAIYTKKGKEKPLERSYGALEPKEIQSFMKLIFKGFYEDV